MKTWLTLFFLLILNAPSRAQTFTVVADSLRLPSGLAAANGQVWVVETGYGFNDGTISLLTTDGSLVPVIVGLPSAVDTATQEPEGPWHVLPLSANRLAVTVGASGQLLIFDLTGFVPGNSAPLTVANSSHTYNVSAFSLSHGFPDSNPYSVAQGIDGNLYVADAAANAIIKVTTAGDMSVFATFPPFANPLPFGPPMVDAVPTRILAKPGGGFYVSQLTGFPFLDGAASVFSVDAAGTVTPYAMGLTQLTDLALDANTGDLYALQFGHFDLMGMPPGYAPNSARVIRLRTDGTRETVAENFGPSAGMAIDGQGQLYVSDIFSGLLLKIEGVASSIMEKSAVAMDFSLTPNPAATVVHIAFSLKTASPVLLRIHNTEGRLVMTRHFDRLDAGLYKEDWPVTNQPPGLYYVDIQTDSGLTYRKLLIE